MAAGIEKPSLEAGGIEVRVGGRFDVTYLKDGEYTLIIPVPDQIADLIGRVVILWGGFELRMDLLIVDILRALRRKEPKGWRRRSFSQRKCLFKEIMDEYAKSMFPAETVTFRRIIESATDLQWQRNTVAHGYIKAKSIPDPKAPKGYSASFYAVGILNDKEVMVELDEATLEKLRHDIAHLGGNLMAAVSRMGGHLNTDSPELVIADKDLLQDALSGSFRTLPISKIP